MIIDEIKKANIESIKQKNSNLHSIYSVIINKVMLFNIEARAAGKETTDDDVIRLIQKTIKELVEEAENYKKVNNLDEYHKILEQQATLEAYLPKMMSQQEIKAVLDTLPDKSVPTVMRYFKATYGSTVDLKLVGEVLKNQ